MIACGQDIKTEKIKTIQIKPSGISVTLKYITADKKYYNEVNKVEEELLDLVRIFYFFEGREYYLGKITRNGVYDSKGGSIYILPKNMKDAYVSQRNLESPASVNFIEYKDGKYLETDTMVMIEVDLQKMTIRKFSIVY